MGKLSKLTSEHFETLREAIFPLKFKKNAEGIRKSILIHEALDIIQGSFKTDVEIACEQQDCFQTDIKNLYVCRKTRDLKIWTNKGFKVIGQMSEEQFNTLLNNDLYCTCPYPMRSGEKYCGKCGKTLL